MRAKSGLSPKIPMIRTIPRFLSSYLPAATFALAQRGAPIPKQLAFTPYHANGIYDVGDTVGWTVSPGPVAPTYAYRWTIRRNNAVVLKEGKVDLSSGNDKIEITGDQPEMIYVAVEPHAKLAPDAPSAADSAPPHSREATLGATTGSTRPALLSRRRNSGFRRRVPATSTHSGTPNSPRRQRSRSTPF